MGRETEGSGESAIRLSALAGQIALSAVKRCSDSVPQHLESVIAEFRVRMLPLFAIAQRQGDGMRRFRSRADLKRFLDEHLLAIPGVATWDDNPSALTEHIAAGLIGTLLRQSQYAGDFTYTLSFFEAGSLREELAVLPQKKTGPALRRLYKLLDDELRQVITKDVEWSPTMEAAK